ncbi:MULTISPECIES: PfkB family carbohydrate kinase [unclassified Curtobacterium]|uniref:PfkB family carbohydrate kinase n=1 Tax=unclassified Curtobacterium TaxID=257496 RepID=UPI000D867A51|nr:MULTISPECIES: PfkB family carbohydrate kinase [unclassified Curtobacterium]PYY55905.1 ribokinase [Curtobacterium sp. MCSS17_011]WIE79241.1 PfkB family carbohydrate kinase [Curtobacterium sp. MCSS17_016]
MVDVVVVGQVARDLVISTDAIPAAGGSAPVHKRIERLGGKGANQALGLHQLGFSTAVLSVVGTDQAGTDVLREAEREGIDVTGVCRRGRTALLLDIVDAEEQRRLFEDVPSSALLDIDDLRAAEGFFRTARTVCLQLQQPVDTILAAGELGKRHGARLVLDGGTREGGDALLELADVVRADATEAEQLTGVHIATKADASHAADQILGAGVEVVAFDVPGYGNLVAWRNGRHFYPYGDVPTVDPTGAGDAFLAGLVAALHRGHTPADAGTLATNAAATTVTHLGGRPDLSRLR